MKKTKAIKALQGGKKPNPKQKSTPNQKDPNKQLKVCKRKNKKEYKISE